MLILELLVVIVMAAFVANGVRAGALETLGRVIGAVLGFLAARAWSGVAVSLLAMVLPVAWAWLVSFIVIFLTVDSIVGFIFKLADKIFEILTKLPIIKQIDGAVGGIFGFFESVVVLGGIAFLLRAVAVDAATAQSIITLKTIGFCETIFKLLLGFLL
jgi:uncharacterized membrane protein required for colicin V production